MADMLVFFRYLCKYKRVTKILQVKNVKTKNTGLSVYKKNFLKKVCNLYIYKQCNVYKCTVLALKKVDLLLSWSLKLLWLR